MSQSVIACYLGDEMLCHLSVRNARLLLRSGAAVVRSKTAKGALTSIRYCRVVSVRGALAIAEFRDHCRELSDQIRKARDAKPLRSIQSSDPEAGDPVEGPSREGYACPCGGLFLWKDHEEGWECIQCHEVWR